MKIRFLLLGVSIALTTACAVQVPISPTATPQRLESPITTPAPVSVGVGQEGKYWLINSANGTRSEFLVEGYELLAQHEYQQFPTYLILRKGNELFSYQVSNKEIKKIPDITLHANQAPNIDPSISQKSAFLIHIELFDPNEEIGMGGPRPISTTSYVFDADTNVTSTLFMPERVLNTCRKYDSVRNQFYVWACGEGIGNAGPLETVNMQGETIQTLAERTPSNPYPYNQVRYNNGHFFVIDIEATGAAKLTVIATDFTQPIKDVYATVKNATELEYKVTEAIRHPYGIDIDPQTSTIVVGNGQSMDLLRYNAQKEIIDVKEIADPEIYPNFVFTHQGRLYYQSTEGTRVVNLQTWNIEKTLPGMMSGEITLF